MLVKKIAIGLVVSIGIALALGAAWYYTHAEPILRLPGVVEIQEVRLSSKVGGRIKQVNVQEGTIVSAGQPLVVLDLPEWEAKRSQLQAQLAMAQAQLDKAHNGRLPEEKATAKAALVMAETRLQRLKNGSRPEEVEAARNDWISLKADAERAQKELQRQQTARNAISASDYEAAVANAGRLQHQARAAAERWKLLDKGPRVEDIQEAAADVEHKRAQFKLLDRGTRSEDIAEAEARVAEIAARLQEVEVQLKEGVVIAPDMARVEIIAVRRGDTVAPNQPVARVLLAEDLWVKAYVPEPHLGKMQIGQEVFVTNDSFPGKRCKGIVTHIAASSEFTPRNVQSADERANQVFAIKIRVLESAHVFKSGMAAEVLIPLQPR